MSNEKKCFFKEPGLKFVNIILHALSETFMLFGDIFEKKGLIFELVKRDYHSRHMVSALGFVWNIAQPLVMMLIMWFVFVFGLKASRTAEEVPFILYFFSAQIAWNFFSESWSSSTGVILEYSFLVKKINFRLSILPIVKIMSALINHAVLIVFLIVVLFINGYYPDIFWLQFIYYLFCTVSLVLGLSWITSAMNVFWRDIGFIISIGLQFGFWLTPIFWQTKLLPEKFLPFIRLNPAYYIVQGYRDTFVYHKWFWQVDVFLTIQFWVVTAFFLMIGMIVFRRLRPHFADVI